MRSPISTRLAAVLACLVAATLAPTAAALAADASSSYQGDARHEGFVTGPDPRPPLRRAWTKDLGRNVSAPLVAGDRVFVTATDRAEVGLRILALDRATGALLWSRQAGAVRANLVLDGGRLLALTSAGFAQAIDPQTGERLWTAEVAAGGLVTPPVAADGRLFTVEHQHAGRLHALDQATGAPAFPAPAQVPVGGLAADGAQLFLARDCNAAAAYGTATGERRWTAPNDCTGLGELPYSVVHDGRLYTADGRIWSTATGADLGRYVSRQPPAFAGDLGLFLEDDGLVARDAVSGLERWRQGGDGQLAGPPLVVGETAYVASSAGTLFAFDLATGAQLAREELGEASRISPRDDVVGLGAGGGTLLAPAGGQLTAFVSATAGSDRPALTPPPAPPLAYDPDAADDDAHTARQDVANTGRLRASTPAPPLAVRWRLPVDRAGTAVAGDGMVFTLATDASPYDHSLVAADARTGDVVWRTRTGPASGAAYDAGRVFVSDDGRISAYTRTPAPGCGRRRGTGTRACPCRPAGSCTRRRTAGSPASTRPPARGCGAPRRSSASAPRPRTGARSGRSRPAAGGPASTSRPGRSSSMTRRAPPATSRERRWSAAGGCP